MLVGGAGAWRRKQLAAKENSPSDLARVFDYVDAHRQAFIDRLLAYLGEER